VLHKFEIALGFQVGDVIPAARNEIVHAGDLVALSNQKIAKMGTDKACSASDDGMNRFHEASSNELKISEVEVYHIKEGRRQLKVMGLAQRAVTRGLMGKMGWEMGGSITERVR
jgi:hypothetical protein